MLARFAKLRLSGLMLVLLGMLGVAAVGGCEQEPGEAVEPPAVAPEQQ